MAKRFLLSERDANRVQKMLRWWDKRVDIRYQRRRRHGGGGGSQLHNAYAKAAAGAGTTIVCFLDSDSELEDDEITVTISIAGGSDLNSALPRLEDGTLLTVWKDGDTWRNAGNPFQASGDC